MDEKTRELYAAIGRGETVQWRGGGYKNWIDWIEGGCYFLGEPIVGWRIKPKTRTAIINGVTYEWPEPMTEDGDGYYVLINGVIAPAYITGLYTRGRGFITKEGAEAFARADKALRGGK